MVLPPRFGGPATPLFRAQSNFYVLWAHALEPAQVCAMLSKNSEDQMN
jgi:hypothetical protein